MSKSAKDRVLEKWPDAEPISNDYYGHWIGRPALSDVFHEDQERLRVALDITDTDAGLAAVLEVEQEAIDKAWDDAAIKIRLAPAEDAGPKHDGSDHFYAENFRMQVGTSPAPPVDAARPELPPMTPSIEALVKAAELCPFCNHAAKATECLGVWAVKCLNPDVQTATGFEGHALCGAYGPERPSEDEAIAAWNTRALANLKGEQTCADCEFGYCMNPAHEATPKPAPEPRKALGEGPIVNLFQVGEEEDEEV